MKEVNTMTQLEKAHIRAYIQANATVRNLVAITSPFNIYSFVDSLVQDYNKQHAYNVIEAL